MGVWAMAFPRGDQHPSRRRREREGSRCETNFDGVYAGADWVSPASNGTDLLMLYRGGGKYYGGGVESDSNPGWGIIGLARSSEQGVWIGDPPPLVLNPSCDIT